MGALRFTIVKNCPLQRCQRENLEGFMDAVHKAQQVVDRGFFQRQLSFQSQAKSHLLGHPIRFCRALFVRAMRCATHLQ